nr:Unknown Function [uncultured bacterium]
MERLEFWFVAPGEGLSGTLTDRGRQQVSAAARKHLPKGVPNWIMYENGGGRARESRAAICEVLETKVASADTRNLDIDQARVTVNAAFGTSWLLEDKGLLHTAFDMHERPLRDRHGDRTTMLHVFDVYNGAWALRVRVVDTILDIAKKSIADADCDGHILVVPSIPMLAAVAVPTPRAILLPKPGDIIRYVVETDHRTSRIIETTYHACPLPG